MSHTSRPLPLPTPEPERRLILAARRGDPTAQARVLAQYEPMMQRVARRLYLPGSESEDLAQEARLALLDATRAWDPDRGVPFSNFAWLCATREARNALRAARRPPPPTTAPCWGPPRGPHPAPPPPRRHTPHLLPPATPLDVADTTALAAGDTLPGHEAVAHRRQRVRPITRACAESGDLDPV